MQKARPLSPHLEVYKPQLTSILSIIHRGSGVFLYLCTPLLVFWLWSIATDNTAIAWLQTNYHWLVCGVFIGWTFCMYYHLCNGIRHLFWDIGVGLELKSLYTSGKIVVLCSLIMTGLTCYLAMQQWGGGA